MMNVLPKLLGRIQNLRARIHAARQAGDDATANRLVVEHDKNVRKHEEIVAENMTRLHICIVGGGGVSITLPRDQFIMYACTSLTRLFPLLEANLAKSPAEKSDADEEKAFFTKLREMLAARHATPLVVTAKADGGAAVPVADVENTLLLAWGARERPSKPSEVTISVATKALSELLAAPRCLLAIASPGGFRLVPLDERTLATPLLELAWQTMTGGAALDDDDRADALGALRRTAVPYVAVDDKADASEPGRERRADYLAALRAGKGLQLEGDLAPLHSDATVADAVEQFPDAPFAVLYVVGCGERPERPRLTLSVRDTYGATSATVVDVVVDSHKNWLPCDFEELINVAMTIATSSTSKGVRGAVGEDFYEALLAWLKGSTAVIHLSVNGASPQLVMAHDHVVGDPRAAGAPDRGPTLDVEVLVPTLPAADARTPAQKFWLEPEVPCLVAACVAALEAGEPHPSKPWKKLHILGDSLGVTLAKNEVQGLMLLIALGRFPRPTAVDATSPFRRIQSVAILADVDDLGRLYDASGGLRRFLDDHCRDLGTRARKDALLLVMAKRLSRLTCGTLLSNKVADHALGDANRASGHPHAVAASLLFAYWVAEGGARGFSFRGSASTYSGDLASDISRRRFVGAVLRAGLHAYGDYDAAGADRAKRSLTDLAVLWTTKFDPDARVCYEAAGAAGNALAADVAARLGTETPATLKKLLRKYPLDAFATKHLETLPAGLARLEAVFRHDPPDEDDGAPRPKKDKRRAAVSSADAAAVGDSFALEDPGASGTLSKKKQAERDRKARDKEKEEKRRAKRKQADARRREQAERDAAALQWRPRAPTRPLDSDDDAATV